MRVLIVGEGKSGTTALLRSISAAIGEPTELFEPELMTHENLGAGALVVKKLLLNWRHSEVALLDDFDKLVFIHRDPRDRLISHLLYAAYNQGPSLNTQQRQRWLEIIEQKSLDPQGIALVDVLHHWWDLSQVDLLSQYVRASDRTRRFMRRNISGFFRLKYEDYVEQKFAPLNDYLGLDVATGVVDASEQRVVRRGAHGDWRLWLTPADVSVLRPITHFALESQGYDPDDWELTTVDSLDRSTTTDYVKGLFDRQPLSS